MGFTVQQAHGMIASFAGQRRRLDLESIRQWLQLLQRHGVQKPTVMMSRYASLLLRKAENLDANAEAAVALMSTLGLSKTQIASVIKKRPMLLVVPHLTMAEAAAWFASEVGLSGKMIVSLFVRHPGYLGSSLGNNLMPKLSWFTSYGISKERMGKLFFGSSKLFSISITNYESQMAAMRDWGLSESHVAEMVRKSPSILARDLMAENAVAKVHFLTRDMGQPPSALLTCPTFLTLSLYKRIGPRWAFWSRHCGGKPFVLSSRLLQKEGVFLQRLSSQSLDEECATRKMSREQLFNKEMGRWQQEEGRVYKEMDEKAEAHRKPRSAAASDLEE